MSKQQQTKQTEVLTLSGCRIRESEGSGSNIWGFQQPISELSVLFVQMSITGSTKEALVNEQMKNQLIHIVTILSYNKLQLTLPRLIYKIIHKTMTFGMKCTQLNHYIQNAVYLLAKVQK